MAGGLTWDTLPLIMFACEHLKHHLTATLSNPSSLRGSRFNSGIGFDRPTVQSTMCGGPSKLYWLTNKGMDNQLRLNACMLAPAPALTVTPKEKVLKGEWEIIIDEPQTVGIQ